MMTFIFATRKWCQQWRNLKKQVRDKAACRILQSSTALAAPLVTQSENFQLKGRLTDTVFVHKLSQSTPHLQRPTTKTLQLNCTSGWLNCFFRNFSTVQINGTTLKKGVLSVQKNSRLVVKGERKLMINKNISQWANF